MPWLQIYLLAGLIVVGFCFITATRVNSESKWLVLIIGLALFPAWLTMFIMLVIVLTLSFIIEDRQRRESLRRMR